MSPLRWCNSGGKLEKTAKYVVQWYNSIALFNKQTYIVSVNQVVIFFCHQRHRICPLKQNLFGWFTKKGFLTATCWNNRFARVESAPGKTVHKLFVGGVHLSMRDKWKSKRLLWRYEIFCIHISHAYWIFSPTDRSHTWLSMYRARYTWPIHKSYMAKQW